MKKGFTLIELMIVVVIIGILAAIAIPNFVRIIDRAKEASVKANMHTVQVTVEEYSVQTAGTYPANVADFSGNLPSNLANPYNNTDATPVIDGDPGTAGRVGYSDDVVAGAIVGYSIQGYGKASLLSLILSPGV